VDPPRVLDPAAHRLDRVVLQPARTAPTATPFRPSLRNRLSRLLDILPAVWLCGVVLLGGRILLEQLRLSRCLRSARAVNDAAILALLEECKCCVGVETPLTVIETNRVNSPALYGLIRPWLLLPAGLLQNFSRGELRHVFLHELSHVKRRDIAVNWLAAVLQVLHWFNPMVWLAFNRMRADRELACDALALSCAAPGESKAYGQTIIKLLEGFARTARLPGLVGILEDRGQMKRRIAMIARFKNTPRWSVWALLLVTALGLITLTDAQSKKLPAAAAANKAPPPDVAEPAVVNRRAPSTQPLARRRDATVQKLDSIQIEEFVSDNLPLNEVIKYLQTVARGRDSEKQGINFILASPTADPAKMSPIDPATGLPAVEEPPDLRRVTVRVLPALRNVTLREALEVVVKTAEVPIRYSIEAYGVVFSLRGAEAPTPTAAEPQGLDLELPRAAPPSPRLLEAMAQKLDSILIEEFSTDNLPLGEVIQYLQTKTRARDSKKEGINFILASPTAEAERPSSIDPATGLPTVIEPPDLRNVTVRVLPALRNVTLREALEVVVKTADIPIRYKVETYGVIFSLRDLGAPPPTAAELRALDLESPQKTPPLTRARDATARKLDAIRIDELSVDNLPLNEVVNYLQTLARARDSEKQGINFILAAPSADPSRESTIDPATGLPVVVETPDLRNVTVRVLPAIRNITLREALEVVRKTAAVPIEYNVEAYGVVFSLKGPEALYPRRFKVDPNTFRTSLRGMMGTNHVLAAGPDKAGAPQSRKQQGAGAGAGLGGITYLAAEEDTSQVGDMVRSFFRAAGVTLGPPKTCFYNDRTGLLWVKATLRDLEIIEQALQFLNMAPPQVQIKVKWCEIEEDASRALGLDWFPGNVPTNTLKTNDKVPVLGDLPLMGRLFRGESNRTAAPTQTTGAVGQGMTSTGLRAGTNGFKVEAAHLTGILTDPQFRVVLHALEQRRGTDVLSSPSVTTLSGRQAQIKTVEVRHIVTDLDWSTNGEALDAKGMPVARGQPISEPFELGPVLDVVPSVGADGYTITLSAVASIKEFVGYDVSVQRELTDDEARKRFGAGGLQKKTEAMTGLPYPLPIFRVRQIVSSAVVWDGQTLVLEGGAATYETSGKGKLPSASPAPPAAAGSRKRLLIFVTPTIIDPAGNRVHTPEEMPFSKNAVPPQISGKLQ
jgi:beta-lactamase regulating signal transducer with metallopeptidase domain